MKYSCACFFMLLLTLSLTGCGLNFQDFSSPDGSYSVKMPGKPTKSPTGGDGEAWETADGRWNFGVVKVNLQPPNGTLTSAEQSAGLDLMVQGMISAFKATTKSTIATNLNGFQGKEIEISIPAGPNLATGKQEPASTAVMRVYVVNTSVYVVMARSSYTISKDTADVKTFFDSFKLNATASSQAPPGMAGMPSASPAPGTGMPAPGAMPPGMPSTNSAPMPGPPPGTPVAAAAPMPGASSGFTATTEAVPLPTPGANPMPTTGNIPLPPPGAAAVGFAPISVNPPGGIPGPAGAAGTGTGNGNTPQYTGTPITTETKLVVGDAVQVYVGSQWVDAKVTRVSPNGGPVQVRSLTKPPIWEVVPRNVMQKVGAPDAPQVAANDAPQTDPAGLPNSKASGFSNPSDSGSSNSKVATKTRSASVTKSAGESKPETTKTAGGANLDGASVDDLIKIIGKKGEHRKMQAVERLRDHSEAGPNPEVAKKIVDLLKTDELIVRGAIAQALEKWASPEIHDAVVKNMTGGTTEVRQSMIKILAASNAEDAAERIAQNLTDKDDRKTATEALLGLGEPAQGAVIKMLNHRDSKVKTAACEILQEIGSADAITALTKANSDWTGTERLAARKALRTLEAKK